MTPRVSVVIPVYNRPRRVSRAIASVCAQTFQDLEIIVVDDASSDETADAIRQVRDPRLRYVRHDTNRGGGAARNTGIRIGAGDLVAFLDSDDEWMPEKLERQVALFDTTDPRVGLVYTGAELVRPGAPSLWRHPRYRGDLFRRLLTDNVVGATSTGVVRRAVLEEVGGFDESFPAMQEMELWLRIARKHRVDFAPGCHVRIYMDADPGRISENVGSRIRARELFFAKHREEIVRAGVAHAYLRESGRLCHRPGGSVPDARRFFLQAIKAKPTSPTAYAFLAVSLLPEFVSGRVIALKRAGEMAGERLWN